MPVLQISMCMTCSLALCWQYMMPVWLAFSSPVGHELCGCRVRSQEAGETWQEEPPSIWQGVQGQSPGQSQCSCVYMPGVGSVLGQGCYVQAWQEESPPIWQGVQGQSPGLSCCPSALMLLYHMAALWTPSFALIAS